MISSENRPVWNERIGYLPLDKAGTYSYPSANPYFFPFDEAEINALDVNPEFRGFLLLAFKPAGTYYVGKIPFEVVVDPEFSEDSVLSARWAEDDLSYCCMMMMPGVIQVHRRAKDRYEEGADFWECKLPCSLADLLDFERSVYGK